MSNFKDEQKQIIEDIQYLEYLIEVEKQDIKERLTKRIDFSAPLQNQVHSMSDELSAVLGQFSARIAILEKTLANNQPNVTTHIESLTSNVNNDSDNMPVNNETKVSIVDIGVRNGMGLLHHTNDNVPFHYAVPKSRVLVELEVNRSKKKTLAIDIVEVSDKAYLDQVAVIVDEHSVKHKKVVIEGKTRLLCYLPVRVSGGKTSVIINIPSEPSNSDTFFKFCLSDVNCVPRMTLAKLAGKLLK